MSFITFRILYNLCLVCRKRFSRGNTPSRFFARISLPTFLMRPPLLKIGS